MNIRLQRHILLHLLMICIIAPACAQSIAGSSITSRTKLQSRGSKMIEQRVYDNGLGDVVQEVQSYPGTSLRDVIVHHKYDEYRRKTKSWMPVTSSSGGGFVSGSAIAQFARSQYSDSAPYARTEYDDFLQSQPASQFKAGSLWQDNDKKVSITYSECMEPYMSSYEDGYMYTTNKVRLFITRSVDEEGCLKAEYRDIRGRLLISETNQGKTYYVHNPKGDISHVIPPVLADYLMSTYGEYSDNIYDTEDMMQKYAYIYRYDKYRHCIYKKLPGCEPTLYIYDKAGNCILTQDGNQRGRGEWAYSIPDIFGRPCISGICHNTIADPKNALGNTHVYAEYDGNSTSTGGYSVRNIALDTQTMYFATYYDSYSFIGHHGVPSSLTASGSGDYTSDLSIGHGLQTGVALAIMDDSNVTGYIYSATYYDSKYHVSEIRSTNQLGGLDVTNTIYSYTDKPQKIKIYHTSSASPSSSSPSLTEYYQYTYDDADRLKEVSHKINNGTFKTLQTNSYNGLGQLSRVVTGTHTTSYTYDIHSWLKSISSYNQNRLFEETLSYADSSNPCYNGNISSMTWKAGDMVSQKYDFLYDNASRLVSASYTDGNAIKKFDTQYSYDCMGNVTSLRRKGLQDGDTYGYIDNLTMSYDGNQLTAVSDAVTDPTYNNAWNFTDGSSESVEYEYDANGNVTKDLNRGIQSILYNSLNLPSRIEFSDGNVIRYRYAADGRKVTAEYITPLPATTKRVDYCSNMVYEDHRAKMLTYDGGFVLFDDSTLPHCSYIKDHLGNNRMVMHPSGSIVQTNNYYPFGGLMSNSTGWNLQKYKYNGKELDRMYGLDWYDYGARWLAPDLCRWLSVDPLCEKYYDVSPYAYCLNNPVNAFDPDGRSPWLKIAKLGKNIARTVGTNGLKGLTNAATYYSAVEDIASDINTVFDSNATVQDRMTAGISLASEVLPVSINDLKVVNKQLKRILPNNGSAKPHGGYIHNKSINERIAKIKDNPGNTNIRKNQSQVDADGNKVGRNRPDVQYDDENGIHHNIEFDNSERQRLKHQIEIQSNDPASKNEFVILQKIDNNGH